MTMLLSMLSPETIEDIRLSEDGVPLIDGDRLTEAGMAYLTSQAEPEGIHSPGDLMALARTLGVSADWHEPDNSGVSARIRGNHLDNAMGSRMADVGPDNQSGEYNIVIQKDGRDRAVVNLATLLSWACGYERRDL